MRASFGVADPVAHDFPDGAAVTSASTGWVLLGGTAARQVGRALVWADRRGVETLHLLAEDDAGTVARRAAAFDEPPRIWRLDGQRLVGADPEPYPVPQDEAEPAGVELLRERGLEILRDGVDWVGEFNGLEVARVRYDESLGTHELVVGVGAYDQDAFAMINADLSAVAGLRQVLAVVQQYRVRGAEPHPANRIVRERWLRAELVEDPARAGLIRLVPLDDLGARSGLHDVLPAMAVGDDPNRNRVLAACSVGIDLELVPAAAELIGPFGIDRILFVVPERDRHPATEALASRLTVPVEFFSPALPWPV